jgi:hypothetical protein
MLRANRSGVALMLVLGLIVVLSAIGTGAVVAARAATDVTSNYRARVVARYAAESGVTAALALLEDSIARLGGDVAQRSAYLNDLPRALGDRAQLQLGDARAAIALVDPATQIDLNLADIPSLSALFTHFTDPIAASAAARAVHAALPVASVAALRDVANIPRALLEHAARYLTVDGDGTINRGAASDTVLAFATGGLRDEPSRITIVSRGWLDGDALTHESEAVDDVSGPTVTLIRWRERAL